jgi:hypothetical protein
MAKCDYCGAKILFGGRQSGDLRFCNDRCFQAGAVRWIRARGRPCQPSRLVGAAAHVLAEPAPDPVPPLRGQEPARRCRFLAGPGMVGLPWGLVLTPVQIGRDIVGATHGPDPTPPSAHLERLVRLDIAARRAAQPDATVAPPQPQA